MLLLLLLLLLLLGVVESTSITSLSVIIVEHDRKGKVKRAVTIMQIKIFIDFRGLASELVVAINNVQNFFNLPLLPFIVIPIRPHYSTSHSKGHKLR